MTADGLSYGADAGLRHVSLTLLGPVGWTGHLLFTAMTEAPEGPQEQVMPFKAQTQNRRLSLPPTAHRPKEVKARARCQEAMARPAICGRG